MEQEAVRRSARARSHEGGVISAPQGHRGRSSAVVDVVDTVAVAAEGKDGARDLVCLKREARTAELRIVGRQGWHSLIEVAAAGHRKDRRRMWEEWAGTRAAHRAIYRAE